jgi:hypothetical protein
VTLRSKAGDTLVAINMPVQVRITSRVTRGKKLKNLVMQLLPFALPPPLAE